MKHLETFCLQTLSNVLFPVFLQIGSTRPTNLHSKGQCCERLQSETCVRGLVHVHFSLSRFQEKVEILTKTG